MLKHGLSVRGPSLVLLLFWLTPALHAAGVTVRFDPAAPDTGPFPTDFLTVSDPSQLTGQRVSLPLPACSAPPATCPEYALLNTLDGFSLHPRLRVRFSGPINPDTLRAGIYLVWLDRLDASGFGLFPAGHRTRINQVVYDPATRTAYAEPDETLEQRRRYALLVTAAVRDTAGDPVEPDIAFLACLAASVDGSYCGRLGGALNNLHPSVPARARSAGAAPVVAASLFTTLSASAWLEQARAALAVTPLNVERAAPLAVFPVGLISSFTLRQQTGVNPSKFTDFTVPFPALLLAGVGRVAFGSFTSPSFLDTRRVVPPAPSGGPVVPPAVSERIQFHVFLPSSAPPQGGYPVVIFGHGLDDSSFGGPTLVASMLARNGFATVAINAVGHGTGPESRVLLTLAGGTTADLPAGGRGLDLNNDGAIESKEGCLVSGAVPVGLRDCIRQTVLDLAQLVRVLRAGVDLDGDGVVDLNPGRIYYGGQSFGAIVGTVFTALEPAVRTAVLNVGGGSVADIARWSQEFHSIARDLLAGRTPSLLNVPGDFNENYVLRDQPVRVNNVAGAIEIQSLFGLLEWLQMPGDPLAFAAHLRRSPLPGATPRPVLWQFARGDRSVPNPQTSALIRTAGMASSAWLYRHDLALALFPDLNANPHTYLIEIRSGPTAAVSNATQSQMAGFFALEGLAVQNPNTLARGTFGREVFEIPDTLPEDLGY